MDVAIVPVAYGDKPLLRNLMNLYLYDFSEYTDRDVNEYGCFEYGYLDHYWTDVEHRQPFLIRVDGQVAGFALVHDYPDLEERPARTIAEFFVLRKHRRRGVGDIAARKVFDLFHGPWEVSEIAANTAAQAFWRRTIDRYTGGKWEERTVDGRVVQLFNNSK